MRILRSSVIGAALFLAGIGGATQPASHVSAATHSAATMTLTLKIVTLSNGTYAFKPSTLKAHSGTTVIWKNMTNAEHTITANTMVSGKPLFNKTVKPGGRVSRTFKKAGTYKYYCTLHPYMKARVVLR